MSNFFRHASGKERLLFWVLLVLLAPSPLHAMAQLQASCDQELSIAEARYLEGRFKEAISLVSGCLDKPDLAKDEAVRVYRMLALAHLNQGDLTNARLDVIHLLKIDPRYVPEVNLEPPSQQYSYSFAGLVISVKQQMHMPLTQRERSLLRVFGQHETVSSARLVEADEAYQAGTPNRTVELTKEQLQSDSLSVVERAEAYRIQGLAYYAMGKEADARKAATELAILYPDYVPNEDDPEAFAQLVEEAQERYKSGEIHRKIVTKRRRVQFVYWALGLAGAAAIIGLAAQDW